LNLAGPLVAEAIGFVARGEHARAEELYREAIKVNSHAPAAWLGLGLELAEKNEVAEAFNCYVRAIAETEIRLRKNPADRASLVARAMANIALYRPPEAVKCARRAIEIEPDRKLHSDIFFLMNFVAGVAPEEHYAEVCRWYSLYGAPEAAKARPLTNVPDPDRRLKVGYVSADFYDHAIMKFVPPVLEHRDRSQFEVTMYSVGTKADQFTEALRRMSVNFVSCPAASGTLEDRVRADGIDILVDLGGHTMPMEAFLVFARKPAPVQVSWLGLLATTGLPQMDYFLGNAELPGAGTEPCFSETVYRLPRSTNCYRATADVPVAPSPCLERGYITFGSYNNPAKIGREVVQLWAEVLRQVPRSHILLKYRSMDTEVMRDRYQGWFRKEGIARDRVEFEGATPVRDYLASFSKIDIALDPFPYQGGSTTMDTLIMGVPIVSLAGRMAVQCSTSSILKAMGLDEMVADTPAQYIKAAVFLTGIVGKIPEMRRNIRKAVQSSPFMDEAGFTRDLEAAYRDMWRRWCRKQAETGPAPDPK
jgi:protein O-GlcNAc transferase